jgi:short-subunit dehydrogenase
MPFLMTPEDAAARTLRGLARMRVRVAYPLPLYLMARLAGGMPPAWRNALMNRVPGKQALD